MALSVSLPCTFALLLVACGDPALREGPREPTADASDDGTAMDEGSAPEDAAPEDEGTPADEGAPPDEGASAAIVADVVAVAGDASSLRVTLRSLDTGCEQYANWWEVVRPDGTLVHRRILGHSHVDEQPFTRSSGPIDAENDEPLIVRAHMFPSGYGGIVMGGTLADGFEAAGREIVAPELADAEPQPSGCAF